MSKLQFKIRPTKERKAEYVVLSRKVRGVCVTDNTGIYKIKVSMKNDIKNPDLLLLRFTPKSYELKGRITVFSRTLDKTGRRIRYVRDASRARCFPGNSDKLTPFAPNWICSGHIVRLNGDMMFEFSDVIGIDGYNNVSTEDEDRGYKEE